MWATDTKKLITPYWDEDPYWEKTFMDKFRGKHNISPEISLPKHYRMKPIFLLLYVNTKRLYSRTMKLDM